MIKCFEMDNGIRVVLEQMPYFRTVSFGVWIKVGSVNETVKNNGISHVIEHCLFKGTKTRSAKQLADEISAIGDQLNAFTGKECTAFYGTTLTEYLSKMMELVGDMLQNSTFEEEPLKKELGVILEEIDMYDDSPEDLVHELVEKNVWKDHALGYIISGEKEIVSKMTREQLMEYMRKYYHGSNMIISIAGNFDEAAVRRDLARYFSSIPKDSIGEKTKDAESIPKFHRCLCERKKDVEQLYMNLAFPTVSETDDRHHIQIMANAVLGGSNNSRLFQQIRENMGLAYSVYSYSSLYRYTGLFHVDVIVNPMNAVKVYEKLEAILKDFSKNTMNEQEITDLYNQLRIEMIMGSESTRNRMERNAKSLLAYGRVVLLDETLEKLSKVTAEDIRLYAETYFNTEAAGICLVGEITPDTDEIKKRWNTK